MITIPEPARIDLYFQLNRRASIYYGVPALEKEIGPISNVVVFFNENRVQTPYSDDLVIHSVNAIKLIHICKWVIDASDELLEALREDD